MIDLLAKLKGKVTIVLAVHDMDAARAGRPISVLVTAGWRPAIAMISGPMRRSVSPISARVTTDAEIDQCRSPMDRASAADVSLDVPDGKIVARAAMAWARLMTVRAIMAWCRRAGLSFDGVSIAGNAPETSRRVLIVPRAHGVSDADRA